MEPAKKDKRGGDGKEGKPKKRPRKQPQKGNCPSHKGGVKLLGGRRGKNRRERVEQGGKTKRKTERSETEKNREEQRSTEKYGKVRRSTENRKGKRGIEMV